MKLGGVRAGAKPTDAHRVAAAAALSSKAQDRAERLRLTVAELSCSGTVRPSAVAAELNRMGITTDRGGSWSTTQATRLLERLGKRSV